MLQFVCGKGTEVPATLMVGLFNDHRLTRHSCFVICGIKTSCITGSWVLRIQISGVLGFCVKLHVFNTAAAQYLIWALQCCHLAGWTLLFDSFCRTSLVHGQFMCCSWCSWHVMAKVFPLQTVVWRLVLREFKHVQACSSSDSHWMQVGSNQVMRGWPTTQFCQVLQDSTRVLCIGVWPRISWHDLVICDCQT